MKDLGIFASTPLLFRQEMRGENRLMKGRRELTLYKPFVIFVNGVRYCVPANMLTDGASIPRIFWRILDPPLYTRLVPAAVVHDAGYGGLLIAQAVFDDGTVKTWKPSRKECDYLLLDIGMWNGFAVWKSYAAFGAVRAFGWIPWKNSHKRNEGEDVSDLEYNILEDGRKKGKENNGRCARYENGITCTAEDHPDRMHKRLS